MKRSVISIHASQETSATVIINRLVSLLFQAGIVRSNNDLTEFFTKNELKLVMPTVEECKKYGLDSSIQESLLANFPKCSFYSKGVIPTELELDLLFTEINAVEGSSFFLDKVEDSQLKVEYEKCLMYPKIYVYSFK